MRLLFKVDGPGPFHVLSPWGRLDPHWDARHRPWHHSLIRSKKPSDSCYSFISVWPGTFEKSKGQGGMLDLASSSKRSKWQSGSLFCTESRPAVPPDGCGAPCLTYWRKRNQTSGMLQVSSCLLPGASHSPIGSQENMKKTVVQNNKYYVQKSQKH